MRGSGTHHLITCASACFALSGNSIPAAPALRMPAFSKPFGAGILWRKVGGEVQLRGAAIAWDAHARAKCEVGIEV